MAVSPKLDKPKILKWYALPLLKSNNFLTSRMIKIINQTTTFFPKNTTKNATKLKLILKCWLLKILN